jgi:hypothetical protein
MKDLKFIYLAILVCVLSDCIYSQTDTSGVNRNRFSSYISPGVGICPGGGITGFAYSVISSKGWGFCMDLKINPFKSKELPDDYMENNFALIPPRDYVNVVSINVVKEFPISSGKFKIGIDVGPSLVFYSYVNFTIDEPYPEEFVAKDKYLKDRTTNVSPGFSCSTNLKYLTGFGGLEISLFADINELKPVFGAELYINFTIEKRD